MRHAHFILVLAFLCNIPCYSQDVFTSRGDSLIRYVWLCKQRIPITFSRSSVVFDQHKQTPVAKKKLLSVTGEMSYQHFDRDASSDDLLLINSTSDIALLRVNLVYKETYPFAFSFRYNKASPFQLDNQYELNLGFDDRSFRQLLMDKIHQKVKFDYQRKEKELLSKYDQVFRAYERERQYVKSPAYGQQIFDQRIRNRNRLPNVPQRLGLDDIADALSLPSVKKPSLALPDADDLKEALKDSLSDKVNVTEPGWKQKMIAKRDSLQQLVTKIQDSIATLKKNFSKKIDSVTKAVSQMKNMDELKEYVDAADSATAGKKNRLLNMLMKTNLRAGKFILNNSELTVTNIFLHGASIKYGDERFVMISGGLYDFAFRQAFNFRDERRGLPKTSVFALRFGKTDGNNLTAFSIYTGKKTKRGSVNDELETVSGISAEKRIMINRNISVDVEVAKSTTLYNSPVEKREGTFKDLFGKFSTKTIGIYNSINAYFPKTSTDAEVTYRYWGQQFQSFNASQYFNPQNNVSGKISQPFFKRKLYVTAGARYSDFKSMGIANNIHTKTLFASASATLRIRKLPIISVGYYPGSQVYLLDQSKLYEYYYYIFNTTASHYFRAGKMPMQVVATRNVFFNRYTDSLVSGSQSYYNLFWTAWKNRFTYNVNLSRQETEWNVLNTIEAGLSYTSKVVRLGGSLKWNIADHSPGMGYTVNSGIVIKRLGTINFVYDRSFLPGRNGVFIPVGMGQVQIVKPLNFSIWQ